MLTFSLSKQVAGVEVAGVVTVYHDPPPTPITVQQIGALASYCVGGGFTAECSEPVARILDPPPPGSFYPDLSDNEVVAEVWAETADSFSFTAALGSLAAAPGVYTVIVWRKSETLLLSDVLVELSVVQS